ncbi:MAG: formylglycine-generating enzyme family protein [Planctomycetes bacterium]|nr:formylglycine-generating enzyme family protein [Planctomycetota bacterium]
MKKTLILAGAAVLLVVAVWIAWAWHRNAAALETAHLALEKSDHGAVTAALDRMTALPLAGALGQTERAAELRELSGRLAGARELAAPEFLELAGRACALRERFPGVFAAVGELAARRLGDVLPDPLHVNASNAVALADRYPVARLAVAGRELARTEGGRFDATELPDGSDSRPVRLEDPLGFVLESAVRVRVDREAPVVGEVRAPREVRAGELFVVSCTAGEPVFEVVEARVEGGRLMGVACQGCEGALRIAAGRPPGPSGVGLVAWSFRVRDEVGNLSAPVQGRTSSVAADRADRIAGLGAVAREELLAIEAWVRERGDLVPDTHARVAAEVARRLQASLPDEVLLDARRRLRPGETHPVAFLEIDGIRAAREEDGAFAVPGLADAAPPRRIVLTDPHGFTAEGRLVVRVDERAPVLRPIDLPRECDEEADVTLTYEADEPLGEVVEDVRVSNARLIAAFVEERKEERKVVMQLRTLRLPPGTEDGRVAWAFTVRDRAGNAAEEVRGSIALLTDVTTSSIGMKLKRLPAGEFVMGSEHGYPDEKPLRTGKIERPFYIGVFEVTQAEWEQVMGRNPSHFLGARRPVDSVSWLEVQTFLQRLSERDGVRYQLPTEAQWEYACRAGTRTEYYWGDTMDEACAWFWNNSGKETHPVGLKAPNPWGLHDMSGNVFEWCGRVEEGDSQIARGGSWRDDASNCRSARRLRLKSSAREPFLGFRLVRGCDD